jgi:hypothetical protein
MKPEELARVFDSFWAVVLMNINTGWTYPNRGLWDSTRRAWRFPSPSTEFIAGPDTWHEEIIDQTLFALYAEDVADVVALATDFTCRRCYEDEPGLHLIAPGLNGRPTAYCLLVPELTVVSGTGKKHYGGPDSDCRHTQRHVVAYQAENTVPQRPGKAIVLWGQPSSAPEVRDMDWCARCSRSRNYEPTDFRGSWLNDRPYRWFGRDEQDSYFVHWREVGFPRPRRPCSNAGE